jgi:hypothetical protein
MKRLNEIPHPGAVAAPYGHGQSRIVPNQLRYSPGDVHALNERSAQRPATTTSSTNPYRQLVRFVVQSI